MRRRHVLASITATGVLGAGTAAGRPTVGPKPLATADFDAVTVRRNGEVVKTVENPSTEQVMRMLDETGTHERLTTANDDCIVECREDCPTYCDTCMYGCDCFSCNECC